MPLVRAFWSFGLVLLGSVFECSTAIGFLFEWLWSGARNGANMSGREEASLGGGP